MGVFLYWAISVFIFFKVAFDNNFSDLTIFADILLSVIFVIILSHLTFYYAKKLIRYNLYPKSVEGTLSGLFYETFYLFVAAGVLFCFLARVIIFGFSKDLNSNLRYGDDKLIIAYLILFTPLAIHYFMVIHSTWYNLKKPILNKGSHSQD